MKKRVIGILLVLTLSAHCTSVWGNTTSHLPYYLEHLHFLKLANFTFVATDNDGWDEFLYTILDSRGNMSLRSYHNFDYPRFQDNQFPTKIDQIFTPFVLRDKAETIYIRKLYLGYSY